MNSHTLYLINCIAAFFIAILSGLGVGSGGLLVAYLSVTGQSIGGDVRGVNLLFFILSAATASLLNLGHRRYDGRLIFLISALGIVGSLIGTLLSQAISPETVRTIFGYFLIFSGIYTLTSDLPLKKRRRS